MFLLFATAFAAEGPALAEYYERRLRHNADLVDDHWTVLRGGLALPARDFALEVGDVDGLRRLNHKRDRWLGVAVAAVTASVAWAGVLTVPRLLGVGRDGPGPLIFFTATPALVAVPLVAINLSSRPKRARVGAYYDEPEVDALIEGYNRDLARDLALDPSVVEAP